MPKRPRVVKTRDSGNQSTAIDAASAIYAEPVYVTAMLNQFENFLCVHLKGIDDLNARERVRLAVGEHMHRLLKATKHKTSNPKNGSFVADDNTQSTENTIICLDGGYIEAFAKSMTAELRRVGNVNMQKEISRRLQAYLLKQIEKSNKPVQEHTVPMVLSWLASIE